MNSFRILVCAIFAIALIAAPWPIGGNYPFARTWLLVFALLGLLLALFDAGAKRSIASFPWVWLGLALGAGYIFFQCTSASESLNQMFGGPRPYQDSSTTSTVDGAISVYPAATRAKLVDVLLGTGIFFASTVLLRERRTITVVLSAAAIVGAALSFFGVVQNLSWNGKIFWKYELLNGGFPFGTFVNKNNAAGFLLATFSAALFFVSHQLFAWNRKHQPQGLILADDHWEDSKSKKSLVSNAIELFAELQPKQLYCCAAIAIIFAGVLATLSRGGMVALAATCLVAFAVLSRTNKWVVTLATICLIAVGTGFVVYSEQSTEITEKIESLSDIDNAAAPRLLHWQDAVPYASNHLVLGCGAGTYRYVANSFQSFFFQKTYAHAENVFLETLIEMGVGAVVLLLLVIAYCFYCSIKLVRRTGSFDRALGVVGLTCLVGQTIASILDFGIYQPANTTMVAVLIGCVVGRSLTDTSKPKQSEESGGLMTKLGIKLMLIAALVSCSWAAYESYAIETRKQAKRTIALINEFKRPHNRFTSNRSLDRVKRQLEHAISVRADDMEAHYQMGEYNIARYRAEASSELMEQALEALKAMPNNGEPKPEIEMDALWSVTAPTAVHRQLRFAQRNNQELVNTILNDSRINQYFAAAWQNYVEAEKKSAYLPKTQYRLAELSAFFDPGSEEEHIEMALSRTLSNTRLMFSCGLLALNSGNQQKAVELWSKCLANPNSRPYLRPIVEISQAELPMKLFFEKVLPQEPAKLISVAQKFFHRADLLLPKRLLLVHTKRLIADTDLPELERLYFLAEACRLSEEFEPAAELYRQALELDPSQVIWRFDYAKCLHRSKQYDEAIRQLKICELEPSRIHRNIKTLLNRIRRDRARDDRAKDN